MVLTDLCCNANSGPVDARCIASAANGLSAAERPGKNRLYRMLGSRHATLPNPSSPAPQQRTRAALRKLSASIARKDASLIFHRHPDLQPAIAGGAVELLVIALEVRRVRDLEAGLRQPLIPDRADGAADGRNVFGVAEHDIALCRNPHAGELPRQVGEVGNLDAGDVVEIAGIVAVAADPESETADAVGNLADLLVKLLPLVGDAG